MLNQVVGYTPIKENFKDTPLNKMRSIKVALHLSLIVPGRVAEVSFPFSFPSSLDGRFSSDFSKIWA